MNKRNIHYRTAIPVVLMALTLACLPWQRGQGAGSGGGGTAGGKIVGLWQVHYTNSCSPISLGDFLSNQQFHSDGLEYETPIFGGECIGTWKQMASSMVQLYHVGWTPGGASVNGSVRFVLTETITVSLDGNSFDGTVD